MIQNFCYISVAQRYVQKRKRGYFLMKIALDLWSGPSHLILLSRWLKKARGEWLGSTPCVDQRMWLCLGSVHGNAEYWHWAWNPDYWQGCCLFRPGLHGLGSVLSILVLIWLPQSRTWALPPGICSPGTPGLLVWASRMGPCSLKFFLAVGEVYHE